MSIRYLTIEREYGSGGTTIARRLAEETNIPCYGREILEAVAKKKGISVDEVERSEETVSGSFLYNLYLMGKAGTGEADMLSEDGHVFVAEQEAIREFAKRGRCIFVGHCAAEALRDQPRVARVFIRCSDEAARKKRIMEQYGIPDSTVEATRKWFDRKRANYYNANTGKKWSDLKNYDIILDSGIVGVDGCVAVLKGLFA
ncbi:MAG: cytidylate kinase-like family protein [Lachnospiraceae bacterium]|nr:cytidylate kinase-like family protein [Lachnospiraceae bacterium]